MDNITVEVYSLSAEGSYTESTETHATFTKDKTDQGFKLTFTDGIDKPHKISFKTKMVGESVEEYTNKAKVSSDKIVDRDYIDTVEFEDFNKFIAKTSDSKGDSDNEAYKDDQIRWTVNINESLSEIENAVFTDTMSKGLVYLANTLELYDVKKGKKVELAENDLEVVPNDEGTTIKLTIGKINSDYRITYDTVVVGEVGDEISNEASLNGTTHIDAPAGDKKYEVIQSSWGTGTGTAGRGQIEVKKVDAESKEIIANNPAEFELYYYLNDDTNKKYKLAKDEEKSTGGYTRYPNLPYRTYYLEEKTAPVGYVKSEGPIEIVINKDNKEHKQDVENTKIKISITGSKEWEGGPEEKPDIQLQLYRQIGNGKKQEVEVPGDQENPVKLEEGTISHTWENLDLTDNAGKEYKYTVDEVKVPHNYEKSISEDGLTITNTYNGPTVDITGIKDWINGPKSKPNIELQLYRNEKALGDPVELANGETEYTWVNLVEADINGVDYRYTVDEVNTPENYGKSISENGLKITNTYKSPKTDITGVKEWVNGPKSKPTVELQLYRNGETLEGYKAKLENGAEKYTWKDLDTNDKSGEAYEYTVKEVETPDNYEVSYDGLTVTNTYVIPKTQVTGTKVWEGGPSRKPTIKLQLYKDGKAHGEPVELKDGVTGYTWTELDKTDKTGKAHVYTVDEVEVPSRYRKSISSDGLTITNRRTPDNPPPIPRGGTLLLEKEVSGKDGDKNKKFEFTLDFQSDDQYYFYDGSGGMSDGVIFNGETVELAHGESILIRGIPEGTRYTIREADYSSEGYVMSEQGSKGIVDGDRTAKASFTNTKGEPVDPEDPKPVDPEDPDLPDPEKPVDPDDPEPVDPDSPEPTDPTEPTRPRDPEDPPRYTELPDPNDPESPDKVIIVDEDGVPLGSYTKKQNPDGTFVYIEDEDIPLGQTDYKSDDTKGLKDPDAPQTGDNTPVIPLLIVFITSLLSTAYLIILRKKKYS